MRRNLGLIEQNSTRLWIAEHTGLKSSTTLTTECATASSARQQSSSTASAYTTPRPSNQYAPQLIELSRAQEDSKEEGKSKKVKGKSQGKPIFLLKVVSAFLLPFTF